MAGRPGERAALRDAARHGEQHRARCADRRWSRIRRARGDTLQRRPARRRASSSELAVDEMMFEIASLIFRDRPAAHRHAGLVHRLAAAADQIMPVGERLALGAQPIGAGRGQPVDLARAARRPAARNRGRRRGAACSWSSGSWSGRAGGRRRWSACSSPVASSSSLCRQHLPQPSHKRLPFLAVEGFRAAAPRSAPSSHPALQLGGDARPGPGRAGSIAIGWPSGP